jgi:hypothetical protein
MRELVLANNKLRRHEEDGPMQTQSYPTQYEFQGLAGDR